MSINEEQRKSNFELLRIFAMLLIVLHHFNVHGIFSFSTNNVTPLLYLNNCFSAFCSIGGEIGVTLFILISGYFLCDSNFKLKSLLNVWITTIMYSLLFLIISFLYGNSHVDSHILNTSIFPICGNAYWFITTYIQMYLFVPFINYFINNAPKKLINKYLLLNFIIWCCIPIFHIAYDIPMLLYFIFIYVVGASIKRNFFEILTNLHIQKKLFFISVIFYILLILLILNKSCINLWDFYKFIHVNFILIFILSICIFNLFVNIKIPYNKMINWIASSTFSIYLIHDNNIVRPFLWEKLLHVSTYINSQFFIFYMVGISVCVFVFCLLFDKCFKFIYSKIINFIEEKILILKKELK